MNMELDFSHECLPRHLAIIMDGNGRWAMRQGKKRVWGHRAGSDAVQRIVRECSRLQLTQLTLYAFSAENWRRPKEEVALLMELLHRFLREEREEILQNNIRFTAVGRLHEMPENIQREIEINRQLSAANTGMVLCLALSYGGRNEILDATKLIVQKAAQGEISAPQVTEEYFVRHLYQPDMLDPDLVIRTGGEMRMSNFLLWQASYAEFWFTPVCWPDFDIPQLHQALKDYALRERHFGKVSAGTV